MKLKRLMTAGVALLAFCQSAYSQTVLDSVAVKVNDGVVLQSEVDALVNRVTNRAKESGQELPSETALRRQAIDKLIDQTLLLQMGERIGLRISDAQLDQTLTQMAAEQGATLDDMRRSLEASGDNFQTYREEIRNEMIASRTMRASVERRVYVSLQEVQNLLRILEQQGQTNEEYNVGHILIEIPDGATAEEIKAQKERAEAVIRLLNEGREFKQIAIASSGGAKALEGGQLGWMNINEMPTLFAEAVKGHKKGDIVGPLRSGAGFHIVKLQDVRGVEVVEAVELKVRHILVKPSIIVSEEKARSMLAGFVTDLKAGNADFAELAKEHSEDPGSALNGGAYDWTDPNSWVGEFKETALGLEKGQISEPFRTQFGWHIMELMDRRISDKTELVKQNRAHQMIFNRRFKEESFTFQRELREQAYIEVIEE
ncbi:peptidylprolyl isomerase SurA [Pseudoalteromonas sp. G4]|uniref:peptidylprolyl isomerase SurA n=1 Tax=Pseudoalteromonas sp. G4 TaxID=2992761 RepID=UPI00237E50B2|nr:peptidylprolyl isomerase SurA [Pseudoalteromonas sp. G4]MDE3273157.1 peptidylprolyl isomerase SurA [Pseudoalteromonas sp. G4]